MTLGAAKADVVGVLEFALATTETTGLDGALLVKVMTPVTDPALWGANWIVTVWLVPGPRVSGNAGLRMVKPLPLIVAAVTTVFAVPGLEITSVCVEVAPTLTLPKNREVGVALNAPTPVTVVEPLPETERVTVGFEALEAKDAVPVTAPLALGVNVIDSA